MTFVSEFSEKDFISLALLSFALAFSVGAAVFDVKTRKIPNKYNLGVFVFASIFKLVLVFLSFEYLISGALGCLLGFLLFLPFFAIRMAGAGDVKLLSVLGMILGWKHFLWVFVLTSIIDGLILIPLDLAKTLYLFFRLPLPLAEKLSNLSAHLKGLKRSNKKPYALPVALGCLSYLLVYIFCSDFFVNNLGETFQIRNY